MDYKNKIKCRKLCGTISLLFLLVSACVAQRAPEPKPEQAPAAKPEPKAWLDLYGFAMMETGYDFKTVNPDWFDVVRPTKLPSKQGELAPNGNAYFSVRQTRFGAKSEVPTSMGTLKTIFEFELFGTGADAGQTTFRLRHAWGELGHFGAGQYNSTFMDGDVFPNTNEYWGPPGMVLYRNVQFRWTPIMGESRLAFAVERPGASADQGIYANRIELQDVKPHFSVPDFTGHGRLGRKWGYVQLGGIVRRIAWVDKGTDQYDLSGDAWGWGLNFTSTLKAGKKDALKTAIVYGKGIQNYMNDAPTDIGIRNNFGNQLTPVIGVPLPMFSMILYYDHYWSDKWSSSIGYSRMDIDNSDAQANNAYRVGQYASTNLLYYPVKDVMAGAEFIYGYRKNFKDGFSVPDYRVQFSFKYNFSFRVGKT